MPSLSEVKNINEGWELWLVAMRNAHGEPPPNALPLLKMTYYGGALASLAAISNGAEHDDLMSECHKQSITTKPQTPQ